MEIVKRNGIGDLIFGDSMVEIVSKIGDPSKQFVVEDGIIFQYNRYELRIKFYSDEDYKFGYLISSSSEITINNKNIISKDIDYAQNLISESESLSWEKEDYDTFTSYFNESNWISLKVKYGIVTEFEMGVPFLNENDYDWPNKKR